MFMNLKILILNIIAYLINSSSCVVLVHYELHMNKTIIADSQPTYSLLEPFKVKHYSQCGAKCNDIPECQVVTINTTNYCTLFSSQITILDIEIENGTVMMTNKPIKECQNPDYFADMIEMVCKQKFTESMVCSRNGQCSNSKGLFCKYGTCQCQNPNNK